MKGAKTLVLMHCFKAERKTRLVTWQMLAVLAVVPEIDELKGTKRPYPRVLEALEDL